MTNTETNYNGYTNYATWRVMTDLKDDYDFPEDIKKTLTANDYKSIVEECLEFDTEADETTLFYALAFLKDVNWHQVCDALKDE